MVSRWVEALLSIAVLLLGLEVMDSPYIESWKYGVIGFGGYHRMIGGSIALVGAGLTVLVFRQSFRDCMKNRRGRRDGDSDR